MFSRLTPRPIRITGLAIRKPWKKDGFLAEFDGPAGDKKEHQKAQEEVFIVLA